MFRRLASLLLALSLGCSIARADLGVVDYTDLWWNPAENGWGVAIQRQGDVLFVSVYHYAADGTPTWYFASDVQKPDFSAGLPWSGKLYRATGPAFTKPFSPPPDIRETGTLSLSFMNANTALLTYSVEGVTVSREIQRMTFRVPSIAGSYYGGFSATISRCSDPNQQGTTDFMGALSVIDAGNAVALQLTSTAFAGLPSSCTFNGARGQAGRNGSVEGSYTCNLASGTEYNGENIIRNLRIGTFVIERMVVNADGFSAKYVSVDQDCTYTGQFGGVKTSSAGLPDRSGFWSTAGEAGWGAQITQQRDTAFLTLYVYDAAGKPTFFVASGMSAVTSNLGPGFLGTLYRTSGTPRGAAYDANRFHAEPVGTASVIFDGPERGTLLYTVDGIPVQKSIRRELWRPTSIAGNYKGGLFVSTNGCSAGLGLPELSYPGSLQVTQSGDQVTIDTAFEPGFAYGGNCRYVGRLQQLGGLLGITQGSYGCEFTNGITSVSGTFEVSNLQVAESGFTGSYRGNEGTCVHTGNIGGIVRGYNLTDPVPDP